MVEIKNRFSGRIIAKGQETIQRLAQKNRADLRRADLEGAYLRGADLRGADLEGADLRRADLEGAYLRRADLRGAYLRGAYLRRADLRGAYLRGAYLRRAYLRGADLKGADLEGAYLEGAYLEGAYLEGAKIEFYAFPSIRLLSSITLRNLPNNLTLELMRRDAYAHPYPKKFNDWAKGDPCPYQNEERFWHFKEKKELWRKGKPQMRDSDLIIAICKSQGWKLRGF